MGLTYAWTQTSGRTVTLSSTTAASPTFTAPQLVSNGSLVFSLTVSDGVNTSTADTVSIGITAGANDAPTARAGADRSVVEAVTVTLNGAASTDPENETLSYSWAHTSGTPSVSLTNANQVSATFTSPTVPGSVNAALVFTLTVTDARGLTATDTVTITVVAHENNQAPTADAGSDQTGVSEGATVTLDGTGSSDPENEAISYSWSQTGGRTVTLSSTTAASPTFTAPQVVAANGTLTFSLTVTAGSKSSTADTVDVTITPGTNDAPTANAGSNQSSVAEGSTVTLSGSGSDPEGVALTYAWTQTAGRTVSLSSTTAASPTFTAPQVVSTNASLTFSLTVSDGVNTSVADTVTVAITPGTNDSPTANAGADQTVAEAATVTLSGSTSTDPEGVALSYAWTQTSGATVSLSSATAASPTFTAPTQLVSNATLVFSLTVSDGVNTSTADTVTVTVTAGANDAPTANAGSDKSVVGNVTVTLSGSGTDPEGETLSYSWTQTSGTPTVTLSNASTATASFTSPTISGSVNASLVFTLTVTDARNASSTDTVTVTVVADANNQAPTANAGTDQTGVAEGATVTLSGSGTDPENEAISYAWSQTAGRTVTLSSTTAASPTFTAPQVVTSNGTLTFSLIVTAGSKSSTADTVDVTITPGTNDSPTANAGSDQSSVAEGATVTLSGSGSDPEGVALSYAWNQTGGRTVSLSSSTAASPMFTAPQVVTANASLTFSLTVSDGVNTSTADTVTVAITPGTNDAPTANAGADQSVSEAATVTLNGTASTDPEAQSLSYSWSQTSGATVTLSSTTAASPTFTAPSQLASNASLVFSLTVSDGTNTSTADTVTVTVTAGANDAPSAEAGSNQSVAEGVTVTLTGSGSDPEGETLSYSWSHTSGTPTVTLTNASSASASFTAPSGLTGNASLVFTLTVSDARGASSTDTVTVTVISDANNQTPTVSAGADQTGIAEGATVTLSGTASDAEGEALTYAWTQTSGTPNVTLTNASSAGASFTAPSNLSANTTLVFTLSVTDGSGNTGTDTVSVSVLATLRTLNLSVSPSSVSEGASATTVTVTAATSTGNPSATARTVSVSIADGTAASGTDYTVSSTSLTVTIAAGSTSGTGTFTLTPISDTLVEGDETISLSGSTTGLTVNGATVTLADNDATPSINLTLSPTSVSEDGGNQTVTVTATSSNGNSFPTAKTVTVSVGSGTAISGTDFAAVSDVTITLAAATTSATGSFVMSPTPDDSDEPNETITVSGTSTGLTVTSATLALNDSDASPAINLSVSPSSLSEGASATTVTVTATLSTSITFSAATAVTVSVGGGTAVSGSDYTAVSDFTLTIPADASSATATFSLAPIDDSTRESAETLRVSGSSGSLTVNSATVTLNDNDTPPSAPAAPTVTAGDSQLSVSWAAPAANGDPIDDYDVRWRVKDTDKSTAGSQPGSWLTFSDDNKMTALARTITSLTNAEAYQVQVRASNGAGPSSWSSSAEGTPVGPPLAPGSLTLASAHTELGVSWDAPDNQGASITGYTLQWKSGAQQYASTRQATTTSTSHTITGLTNGTDYTARVRAANSEGSGAWATATGTPATTPDAPTDVTAGSLNRSLMVNWTAPVDDGGSAVTNYALLVQQKSLISGSVLASAVIGVPGSSLTADGRHQVAVQAIESGSGDRVGGQQAQGANQPATSMVVKNLYNDVTYEVTVQAENIIGRGPSSEAAEGTPTAQSPSAPAAPTVTSANASLSLSWDAPASNGADISGYAVQWKSGAQNFSSARQAASASTSFTITGLTNDTTYTVRLRATNSVGDSGWSSTATGTPAAQRPSTPSAPRVSSDNESLDVSWSAPAANGASITGYTVQWKSGDQQFSSSRQATSTTTSYTITGLTNDTTYTVRVRATNSVDDSAWSSTTTGTPETQPPSAPSSLTLDPGNGTLGVSWSVPAANGSQITGYRVQWKSGAQEFSSSRQSSTASTSYTIRSLTNDTTYTVRVRALYSAGSGEWSPVSSGAPAAQPPSAPAAPSLTADNAALRVSWSAPASNGASITGYAVQWKSGAQEFSSSRQASSTSASYRISGLTNDTTYTVRVRAVNSAGSGAWSAESSGSPAAQAPAAPNAPRVTGGNTTLAVSWSAPAANGASITGYGVQWRSSAQGFSGSRQASASSTSHTITGLTNDTTYIVRVRAVNSVGSGSWSPESSGSPAAQAPAAPGAPSLTADNSSLRVSWSAPAANGASITGYRVQWKSGTEEFSSTRQASASSTSARISGLTNDTTYTVRVRAANSAGSGAWSAVSSLAPAAQAPSAPAAPSIASDNQSLTVSWSAPASNGASITGFTVQWKSGTQQFSNSRQASASASATSHTISSLTNDTTYTVRVRAVNSVGSGSWSPESSGAPAAQPPSAPSALILTAGNRSLSASWTTPSSNGSLITGYAVQWKSGEQQFSSARQASVSSSATSHTITGLTNGRAYTVRVRALYSAGSGDWSPSSSGTPAPQKPSTPPRPSITVGHNSLTVSWSAPASNGASITGYNVQWKCCGSEFPTSSLIGGLVVGARSPVEQQSAESGQTTVTGTSFTITGLTDGTAYTVRVRAVNSAGEGDWTSVASGTPAPQPPSPPKPRISEGDKSLTISWPEPAANGAAITRYTVQWKSGLQDWDAVNRQARPTAASHTLTELTNGTAYTMRVLAVNSVGGSDWSAEVTGTPAVPPSAPVGFVAEAGVDRVTLTWDSADDGGSAIKYWQYQQQGANAYGAWVEMAASSASTRRFVVSGLTGGVSYKFRIRAVNGRGFGAQSEESESVTPAVRTPVTSGPGASGPGSGPPTARTYFTDDDGSVHEAAIEAIVDAGIATGCDAAGTLFCPDRLVRRDEMASFLARAFKLPGPPALLGGSFIDIADSPHRASIEAIVTPRITIGCESAGPKYCPDRPTSRAEMATFIARALKLPMLPIAPDASFEDTFTEYHRINIAAVAAAGFTNGCDASGTRYCPSAPITRAQMATFLARALNLIS